MITAKTTMRQTVGHGTGNPQRAESPDCTGKLRKGQSNRKFIPTARLTKRAAPSTILHMNGATSPPVRPATNEPLLTTKLSIPRTRPHSVPRDHLLNRLDECRTCGLILVSAPAGYGKTTLISTWAQRLQHPVAWLSLDEADNDPIRFLRYLLAGVQQIDASVGRKLQHALASAQQPPATLVGLLINDLAERMHTRFLLAIDDYHLIDESAVHEIVQTLVAHRPPSLQLVIVTREDPPLPLARLRARGELAEVRAHDLRFSSTETVHFLHEVMGLTLPSDAIRQLEQRVEGWPAGLQLAALTLQNQRDPSAVAAALSGNHHFILSYLTEEVLHHLPEPQQQFLLDTSVLPRLSGAVCDAITGRRDSASQLEELYAANIFVIPLDDAHSWWRYHSLFGEILRVQLQRAQPERAAQLRNQASVWFEAHGAADEAIDLAFTAGDYARVAYLIEAYAQRTMMQGYLRTVETWLRRLPEAWRSMQPHASLAFAWSLILRGRLPETEPHLLHAEVAAERVRQVAADEAAAIQAEVLALRAVLAALRGDPEHGCELARESVSVAPATNAFVRGAALFALGTTCNYAGKSDEALLSYQAALPLCQASGNRVAAMLIVGNLTLLYLVRGQLHAAAELCRNVIAAAGQIGQAHSPALASVYGGYSNVLYEWNRLEEAQQFAAQSLDAARLSGHAASIVYGCAMQARILQAQGNLDEAAATLAQAASLNRRTMPAWVTSSVAAQEAALMVARGDLSAAAQRLAHWGVAHSDPVNHNTESTQLAYTHLLLYQAERATSPAHLLDTAHERASSVLAAAIASGRMGRALEALVLRALVSHAQGGSQSALADLHQALILGESEEYVRPFVNAGAAMRDLLAKLLRDLNSKPALAETDPSPAYLARLLAAFPPTTPSPLLPLSPSPPALIEPLTDRELEVLRLMAEGLTYQEVADRLIVSVNTVRYHVKSLYGKLGVDKRLAAIETARTFGVL
jgi:LuxR family maltose regulon positive regulatory protein